MKILHTADIHFSREHQVEALASLTVLAETVEREKPALVAISGDLFDRGAQNSTAGGFPALLAVVQRILDVCPIAAVAGTPTHDLPGCYDALERLSAGHGFTMLEPPKTYAPYGCGYVAEWGQREEDYDKPQLLILGCPEPSREWLLAGNEGASAQETVEAMKTALRGILLGLGAFRAQHPELPCVMLYHGPVEGASMQNGQVIGSGSITIGREDLALVGADYFALGDIHLAQQIPGIPAYYPGSAYPVSWGELGVSGFNLVEIDTTHIQAPEDLTEGPFKGHAFPLTVTRVNYPHPRRVKFSLSWPEPVAAEEVAGVQAWICYRATKEEAAKIDTAAVLEAYIDQGALPGSRVTVELIPTETVRAAEITEKHSLRDKVAIYAEASGQDPTLIKITVIEKADQLEREAEERGSTAGMHFRLRRLRLRGAVGIWKGLRQDEIDINLDKYDPGLIALIGANGAGKSTLIENMHPYPCMLTRDGKLQDHFRLRDSARELWFVDERTGAEYRALMEIDGANASGAVKYHLFKNGEPVTNGRKEDYEESITGMIGSLPLFLRSAFVSQRPTKSNPDLSDATKGEKKAIFRELAGLDYIQAYSESAKQRAAQLESQVTVGHGQAELLERIVSGEPTVIAGKQDAQDLVIFADAKIEDLTTKGKDLREKVEQLTKAVAEQDQIEKDSGAARDESDKKTWQAQAAKEKIADFQTAIGKRDAAEGDINDYEVLKEGEAAENERLSGINSERAQLSAQYADTLRAHQADVRGLEVQRTRIRTEKARMEGDLKVLLSQSAHLKAELEKPLTENCPTCGQLLPEDKRHVLLAEREEKEKQSKEISEKIHALANQIMAKEGELRAIVDPANPVPTTLPPYDGAELGRIKAALGQIDITVARTTMSTAAKAETEIATLQSQIATLEDDALALAEKAEQLRAKLFPKTRTDYSEAQQQYEAARTAYTTAKEERATAAAKLEAAQAQLAAIEKQKRELEELRTSLAKIEAEAAEWRYLEQACGPDGIQALELDALGPSIASTANRVLSAAYNTRFQIEFKTTRMAGKGKSIHQVEDFEIVVHDNEMITEQSLDTLSGGEAIWIKQAIYAAFSIVRDHTTGVRFLTCYKDECDGALDPESRAKYFQMLQAEHAESGRRHTLIITHSESAQEMISQRIIMRRQE